MQYLEFDIPCSPELGEILIAELSQISFDSFLEEESGIKAYIQDELFNPEELRILLDYYEISYEQVNRRLMEQKNWNEAWEKNYQPIIIRDLCYIRANFHSPQPQYPFEIIIQPKMSFGTGHHATTAQVIALMCETEIENKKVLDMGCGTGVLAILASKMDAGSITAVDNDEWAYKNTLENVYVNKVHQANVILGDIHDVGEEKYDIILSNITKNANMQLFQKYAEMLEKDGKLIASGFFESDLKDLEVEAIKYGLSLLKSISENNWTAALFAK